MTTIRITSGSRSGESITVEAELVIGRDPAACELVLADDEQVSRQHARISGSAASGWVIRDLGSSNGTFVTSRDGQRRRTSGDVALRDGDQIEIGATRLAFASGGAAAPTVVAGSSVSTGSPGSGSKMFSNLPLVPILLGGVGAVVIAVAALSALLLFGGSTSACGNQEAADKINPSLALILATYEDGSAASGSGFVLTSDGYIMTNRHVVTDDSGQVAVDLVVKLPQGTFDAQYKDSDPTVDLALIKVVGDPGATPISWGSSASLQAGDSIVAAGLPPDVQCRCSIRQATNVHIRRSVSAPHS